MNKILALPMELYHNRKLIFSLAKNDFKTKYQALIWVLYGHLSSPLLRSLCTGLFFQ